jgi:hypothetical protein
MDRRLRLPAVWQLPHGQTAAVSLNGMLTVAGREIQHINEDAIVHIDTGRRLQIVNHLVLTIVSL